MRFSWNFSSFHKAVFSWGTNCQEIVQAGGSKWGQVLSKRKYNPWEFPVILISICWTQKNKLENLKTFKAAEKRILPFQRKADLPHSGLLLILIGMTWRFSTQLKEQLLCSALQFTHLAIRVTVLEKTIGYNAKSPPLHCIFISNLLPPKRHLSSF